jgi:two-component system sensor histidine kinase BaeS
MDPSGNRWRNHWRRPDDFHPPWQGKRRFLFGRFVRFIGVILLLFLIGMAGLAYLMTQLFGGGGQATAFVWLAGCGLALFFPLLAVAIASRNFMGIVNPLARLMAAADAVAEGDLKVRVPEEGRGEFRRLTVSFNRMVSELERSDLLRRNLTADVAHELRTPLHVIQGNLEGIQDGVYQADAEKIELLLAETTQLARLVEDLRTLSLAEAGQLHLQKEKVEVDELLNDVATSFSDLAEAGGVSLSVEPPLPRSPELTVEGDAGRLDQVLSNLVANALRHTAPGGKITLRGEPVPDAIRLQVCDNGTGIPPEDLPFIFDRFWHGDPAKPDDRNASSGLGLAIARQLVQAHGGKISVESQLNQGTTFTIELPAASG